MNFSPIYYKYLRGAGIKILAATNENLIAKHLYNYLAYKRGPEMSLGKKGMHSFSYMNVILILYAKNKGMHLFLNILF